MMKKKRPTACFLLRVLRPTLFQVSYSAALAVILRILQLNAKSRRSFAMHASIESIICPEEELTLHRRLLDGDVTAPADLAGIFLAPLIEWLVAKNSAKISPELCAEAAEDALLALMKSPTSFNPERKTRLTAYLRMSAQGDLKNLMAREKRHRQRQISLENVEHFPNGWKYIAKDNDPSLSLQLQEATANAASDIVAKAGIGLPEAETSVLQLMLQGERRTTPFAAVLGILHLPKKDQRAAVKRVKDKLKKRFARGG